jgi:hypothetical protein
MYMLVCAPQKSDLKLGAGSERWSKIRRTRSTSPSSGPPIGRTVGWVSCSAASARLSSQELNVVLALV